MLINLSYDKLLTVTTLGVVQKRIVQQRVIQQPDGSDTGASQAIIIQLTLLKFMDQTSLAYLILQSVVEAHPQSQYLLH